MPNLRAGDTAAGVLLVACAGALRLPHYGRWAAAIGITVLAVTVIAVMVSAIRGGRRRRR
ncbi:hypothetical protein [Actinomadura miaoliensis]|uniref:Uncharacterized protein n=1 Tax=Actinomadura miaoliensis TaxID=430685 RepID=A0ABP7X349_9ACTN